MGRITIYVQGIEELRHELRALGGPALRSLARRVTTEAMKPVLSTARNLVPVESGQLRASIGQLSHTHRRGIAVSSRVGTRRDFTFKSTDGKKMAQGRGKTIDKAIGKGAKLTKYSAQQYARGIEFGVDKSGRVRRKAGPAGFLEGAIQAHTTTIINHVATELRRYVETTR